MHRYIPCLCLTAKANRARAQSDPTRVCHSLAWLVLLQHIVCCELIDKSENARVLKHVSHLLKLLGLQLRRLIFPIEVHLLQTCCD